MKSRKKQFVGLMPLQLLEPDFDDAPADEERRLIARIKDGTVGMNADTWNNVVSISSWVGAISPKRNYIWVPATDRSGVCQFAAAIGRVKREPRKPKPPTYSPKDKANKRHKEYFTYYREREGHHAIDILDHITHRTIKDGTALANLVVFLEDFKHNMTDDYAKKMIKFLHANAYEGTTE